MPGPKKSSTPKDSKVTPKKEVAPKTPAKEQKAGAAKKVVKKETKKEKKEKEEVLDKSVRSFKVMLPNTDIFVGRFTGLTPYQAANKALSKYYRETKILENSDIPL